MMRREPTDQERQNDKVRKTLRGRAEKACVRCRAKKRTCDGGNPCMRCKESHSACYFSDWHYTVPYPREYVEYLEEQQEQLSTGLMTMYKLLKDSNIRTVPALPEKPQTQELLSALRGLRLDERFVDNHRPSNLDEAHEGGLRIRVEGMPMPGKDDGRRRTPVHNLSTRQDSSQSPIQQSMFTSNFGPAPHQHPTGHLSFPISSRPGFSPLTYQPFEYSQPMHQQSLLLHQSHVLNPAGAAGHTFHGGGLVAIQQPWRQPTYSLSPGHGTPLGGLSNQPTPVNSSPRPFPGNIAEEALLQPPWLWGCESDPACYASHGANTHDSTSGLDLEAIERRADIVLPHDSHTS